MYFLISIKYLLFLKIKNIKIWIVLKKLFFFEIFLVWGFECVGLFI